MMLQRMDEVTRLREQNETLLEENRQLREAMAPTVVFPREVGLRPAQVRILAALMAAPNGICSKELLFQAISGRNDGDENTVKVSMCGLRKKLEPYGVEILTRWAFGYEITAETRARLEHLVVR
jgi:two-component system cell cycle response regulator CtrA